MPIARWKLRRELLRLQEQAAAIPEFFYEPLLRWWHDRHLLERVTFTEGRHTVKSKIALLIVFQPGGIARSTLLTCEHLLEKGYVPLLVSNSPLSAADRERLTAVCWRVVERPNFGYDFGGYRDGIHLLWRWSVEPDRLLLLNDSIWFPALQDDDSIDTLESCGYPFCGALELGGGADSSASSRRAPFLGSFFLMFDRGALRSQAFRRFWSDYRMTSNKYKTIRRGERALSYAMRDAGLRGHALVSRPDFERTIESLPHGKLLEHLGLLVHPDEDIRGRIQRLIRVTGTTPIATETEQIIAARRLFHAATAKSNIFSSAPILLLEELKIPFVKKALDRWNEKTLEMLSEIGTRGDRSGMKLTPAVLEEIKARIGWRGEALVDKETAR